VTGPATAARRARRRPRLVGVSGVDGSGKTSLVAHCVRQLEASGGRPVAVHVYGCVVCRRWTGVALSGAASGTRGGPRGLGAVARTLHAHVDAAEMTLRLWVAALTSRWRGGASPVVTDRSPLDALVKHDPPPGSLAARWYLALGRRYDALVWLDGDPDTLAGRDREHTAEQLAEARAGFGTWSARLPAVTRIDTTSVAPSDVARLACGPLSGPSRSAAR
jgi:hypothetical protein